MITGCQFATGAENVLCALGQFDYLTAPQLARLLYQESSISYVRRKLRELITAGLVFSVPGRVVMQPHIYLPTTTGYSLLAHHGMQEARRVRPVDAADKAGNLLFLTHNLLVRDVLIAAHLLARTRPEILLIRMLTERELKRKIVVEVPDRLVLAPDASIEFRIGQSWEDFYHLEVYRTLPHKDRFQQKIRGYVAYHTSGMHEAVFATPALGIAVFAATSQMAEALKGWTEETLREWAVPEAAGLFFFCSLHAATASPDAVFLSPVWQQPFGTTSTPLILGVDEESGDQALSRAKNKTAGAPSV